MVGKVLGKSAILACCVAIGLGSSTNFMRGSIQAAIFSTQDVEENRKLNQVPFEWECSDHLYNEDGGCDCGCGHRDPDCKEDEENIDLHCYDDGSLLNIDTDPYKCVVDPINPLVSSCVKKNVPGDWTCLPEYFDAGDGCDCGCGAWDPDCDKPNQYLLCTVGLDEPLVDDTSLYSCSAETFKCVNDDHTNRPTPNPTPGTTNRPTGNPTSGATSRPTGNPTPGDTARPTGNPTPGATSRPSTSPPSSSMPSSAPTESDGGLSPGTTSRPTGNPTRGDTQRPTGNPTPGGTSRPTGNPTPGATERPTVEGETERPTSAS